MEILDPHIHLWDVHHTPRPARPLVRALGWSPRLLMRVAKLAFPKDLIAFLSDRTRAVEDYLPEDYLREARPLGVDRFVHVQAGWKDRHPLDAIGETEWLETLRQAGAPLAGIVAYADLRLGDTMGDVLDGHILASPALRGVRFMLAWHDHPMVHSFAPAPRLAADRAWREGFEALLVRDLSFDAWCYHHQLSEVAALARAYPEARVVLCHVGTPAGGLGSFHGVGATAAARDRILGEWRDGLREVAEQPNVACKVSGLTMPVLGLGYEDRPSPPGVDELTEAIAPLATEALDAFGDARCMFASNFPIDAASVDLATLYGAYRALAKGRDEDALFGGNARRFYRIDDV